MSKITEALLNKHLKTHCERAVEDRAAISVLETFLRSDGKINTNFACNDKWPNTDGTFEFISNPNISRRPEQNFIVQIKGTCGKCIDKDGAIKFSLNSLAFPVYLLKEVTVDPGILFVVLNPLERGQERVFWKYMSSEVLHSIDYNYSSCTISFTKDEEICNNDESIKVFCKKLEEISRLHSFVKKLEDREYSETDIMKIIGRCNEEIMESIERFDFYNDTRDDVSRRILSRLENLCVAALLLNGIKQGEKSVGLPFAFELALFDKTKKYLSNFLQMLKYIGYRIPSDGQSERLMLKYYDFMWQIRDDLRQIGIKILSNLEKFPTEINQVDKSYYEIVAHAIRDHANIGGGLRKSRYYIVKQTPFYVDGERYYEVTLQLAGIYATKFNRITAYSEEFISSSYSIQVDYDDLDIVLWNVNTKIKLITSWKISIEPICLNKLAKILKIPVMISSNYGEYDALMTYLTKTGINLLEFIDCKKINFNKELDMIYAHSKTNNYKKVLHKLRSDFKLGSRINGSNSVRYILIRMREEIIEAAMPTGSECLNSNDVYLNRKCLPFEKNPLIANFAGSKTSKYTVSKDVVRAVGSRDISKVRPYLMIKRLVGETGEIYFDDSVIEDAKKSIFEFNHELDNWEREEGFLLKCENGLIYIDSFERDTISIMQGIKSFSVVGNKGQETINKRYIKENESRLGDSLKRDALKNVFVSSKVMLIYGAAGTGKTTLINHISNLMKNRKKLFLTKTHAALQNLQRAIENTGTRADFVSIDSFTKKVQLQEYDVIFIDECSTIDNRTMAKFFKKIDSDTFVVLAGDIYQLEAIDFGNWFSYAKELMPNNVKSELLNTWRTDQDNLKRLWDEVRKNGMLVREKLAMDGPFSAEIDQRMLEPLSNDKDEVVLCLNYDGKFGLNNINALFQAKNNNKAYVWQEWTYKAGDPILFTESKKRFPTVFYNNLKGKIVSIRKNTASITFTVDIDRVLSESDCLGEVEYVETFDEATRIRFTIYEDDGGGTDEERAESRKNSVVPFQLAYAVSIHKAQGLEYDSVKIIIPESNSEQITHGIFYTAITRAKKNLKIYWSPETMDMVLKNIIKEHKDKQSLNIIREKLF